MAYTLATPAWPFPLHSIRVGKKVIEAYKIRIYNISSGVGQIIIREVIPLAPGITLAKTPIAEEDWIDDVDLNDVDERSFQYQYFQRGTADDRSFPEATVRFK
jgi:hypothetical protein